MWFLPGRNKTIHPKFQRKAEGTKNFWSKTARAAPSISDTPGVLIDHRWCNRDPDETIPTTNKAPEAGMAPKQNDPSCD